MCRRIGTAPCPPCQRTLRPARPEPAPPGIDALIALFDYHGPARALVTALKYRSNRACVPWLGQRLAEAWPLVLAGADGGGAVTVLSWAPTSAGRRRHRGFDQSALLARALAAALPVPAPALVSLLRRGNGPPQTGRVGYDRRHAAIDFGVRSAALDALRRRSDGELHIVLVDDVVTTGATVAAAAAALRGAGVRRVGVLAVARAAGRSDADRPR